MNRPVDTRTGHRVLPHTADVIVEAWASSRAGCLEELVRGVVDTFADTRSTDATREIPLEVGAALDEDVVVALLDDVCYLLDAHGLVVLDVALAELDIGVALVRRPDASIGVISERDIVRALANGADPEEVWVADVTSDDIVFAAPAETILTVAEQMVAEGVRHVTVVDHGEIVGVVSARDIMPILGSYARSSI